MTAVTQKAIDLALATRYDGCQIDVAGTPTDIAVFVEEPSSEEYVERVFPSISILFMTMNYDTERAHTDDDELEETGYDDEVDPPIRTSRQKGLPYILTYSLDTWHKVRVSESRDLVQALLIQGTPPRGFMPVTDIDGGTENVWVMWSGGITSLNEIDGDYSIYHKSLTVDIYADLLTDTTEYDDTVVTQLLMKYYARNYIYNEFGASEVDATRIEDVQIRFTDTEEEPYTD